jgi:phosphatidylserine/phosphatidylglycerophosphate/cardiolipin synthase-like enzyme
MHRKALIVDKRHVATGSFNYTPSAAKVNYEDIIICKNVVNVAEQHNQEFERLWLACEPKKATKKHAAAARDE